MTTGRVTQQAGRVAIQADDDIAKGRVTQQAARLAIQADADIAKGRVTQMFARVAIQIPAGQPMMKRATTVPGSRQWQPKQGLWR